MSLMEHLTELRNRIIFSLIAVAVGTAVGFGLYDHIFSALSVPYHEATRSLIACKPTHGCDLITTDVLQPFLVRLRIASYFGILVASPIVLWQVWRFVAPGLTGRERKYAMPFIASTVVLFLLGAVVAWITLPKALEFLIQIGGPDLDVKSTAASYVTLVGLMFIAFGISFEFPVLLVGLLLARVLSTATLRKYRRHAIVGITLFAAVITPSQDPYSLFLMAVPMYIFYELSIVIGRLMQR